MICVVRWLLFVRVWRLFLISWNDRGCWLIIVLILVELCSSFWLWLSGLMCLRSFCCFVRGLSIMGGFLSRVVRVLFVWLFISLSGRYLILSGLIGIWLGSWIVFVNGVGRIGGWLVLVGWGLCLVCCLCWLCCVCF